MRMRSIRLPILVAFIAIAVAIAACGGGDSSPRIIAAGGSHTCDLSDGVVSCWGSNDVGQIGRGITTDDFLTKSAATDIGEIAIALATGLRHTCALGESGSVFCWGDNRFGQLGAETVRNYSNEPLLVEGLSDVVAIGAGELHTCAVIANGGVRCWGINEFGQLGNGRQGRVRFADLAFRIEKVGGLRDVRQVDGGVGHTCAVTNAGDVYCWGSNGSGSLGDGTLEAHLRPAQVLGLPDPVRSISIGDGHTCALLEDGRVFCWGRSSYGQLGDGTAPSAFDDGPPPIYGIPKEVPGLEPVAHIAAGRFHTCAATVSNSVYCWGANDLGQIGGIENDRCQIADPCQLTPLEVEYLPDGGELVAITGGNGHTCVMFATGDAACWGHNFSGQLGDGTDVGSLEPVSVLVAEEGDSR